MPAAGSDQEITVVHFAGEDQDAWKQRLQAAMPERRCVALAEVENPEAVVCAMVWKPPRGSLGGFSNLRCVVAMSAGVDHVLAVDTGLSAEVPVLRLTGEPLRAQIREYVVLHVLALHCGTMDRLADQAARHWGAKPGAMAATRRVGVMGLGNLGGDSARTLAGLGFQVSGWSRTEKVIDGVTCFAGPQGLPAFCAQAEILVNLLPLTVATESVLNAELFSWLPRGAMLVNLGRGSHLVEEDLLRALESGQISAAVLDVFRTEPLPLAHPFWAHPRVWVTPHIGAELEPATVVALGVQAVRDFEAGREVGIAGRERNY